MNITANRTIVSMNMKSHIENMMTFMNMKSHSLKRVAYVVKKLTSRDLAFRGDEKVFVSVKNGNFMMLLELISG